MRKIILSLLLTVLAFSLVAGPYFSKLGKYNDVRVMGVSHRGIQISHEYGICHITDKDLGRVETILLEKELHLYKTKLAEYQKNQQQASKAAQEKLQSLDQQLAQMSKAEIEAWAKKEVHKDIFAAGFKEDFKARFQTANASDSDTDAASEMLTKIFQRLQEISEEEVSAADCEQLQEKLNTLSANISDMTQQDIEKWAENTIGKKVSDPAFRKEFVKKFQAADYRRKLQQAMQDDAVPEDNANENSSAVLEKMMQKLAKLQKDEVAMLQKECTGKEFREIKRIIHQKLGTSIESEDFVSAFNKKYFMVGDSDNIARQLKMIADNSNAEAQRSESSRPDWGNSSSIRRNENDAALAKFTGADASDATTVSSNTIYIPPQPHNNSNRICADCGGAGKVERRINGQWLVFRCSGCSGSGRPHYATDYIQNGRRHRSQMEQNMGKMFGTF